MLTSVYQRPLSNILWSSRPELEWIEKRKLNTQTNTMLDLRFSTSFFLRPPREKMFFLIKKSKNFKNFCTHPENLQKKKFI